MWFDKFKKYGPAVDLKYIQTYELGCFEKFMSISY